MVKVTDKDYYMDGYLKQNLDIAVKEIAQDWDFIILVDGGEGSGKSVIAQQMAYYVDRTFTETRVVFRPEELKDAVQNAKKYTAIVFDEARSGLNSRRAMSSVNVALTDMLAEIRQKNLFIFIVLPTFFDLDRNVALWRSKFLIHVYTTNMKRGNFMFYSSRLKKQLYVKGKKFYNYNVEKPSFLGKFTNFYCIDEVAYRKKKVESLRFYSEEANKNSTPKAIQQRNTLMTYILENKIMKVKEMEKLIDMKKSQVYAIVKDSVFHLPTNNTFT
jgi:ABC-type dipeptide/oligopeptide/nickel transport system ATPase subunit